MDKKYLVALLAIGSLLSGNALFATAEELAVDCPVATDGSLEAPKQDAGKDEIPPESERGHRSPRL